MTAVAVGTAFKYRPSSLVVHDRHSSVNPSLDVMMAEFLAQVPMRVEVGSFDVAGPVVDGHVKMTNLPWAMDETSLARALKLRRVDLMNDLRAVDACLSHRPRQRRVTLHRF